MRTSKTNSKIAQLGTCLAVGAVVPLWAMHASAQTVSVQFPQYYAGGIVNPLNANYGSGDSTDMNYVAGVVPVQNWNVVAVPNNTGSPVTVTGANLVDGTGAALSPSTVVDSTNTPSSVNFSLTYSNNDGTHASGWPQVNWYPPTGVNGDGYLASGSVFSQSASANPVTLTVNGLTANYTYELIAYAASPWYGSSSTGSYTVGNTTIYDTPGASMADGTWVQGTSTNSASPSNGNYVEFTNLSGSTSYTLTVGGNYVGLGGFQIITTSLVYTPPPPPQWVTNGTGDWNVSSNWSGGAGAPSGPDTEADFFGGITSEQLVYTNSAVTVGILNFNNSKPYVIQGTGSITLQSATGSAGITVQQGTDYVGPLGGVILASPTNLNVAPGANLVFSGPVTVGNGVAVTATNTGTVTYDSTVTLQSGASLAFAGNDTVNTLSVGGSAKASITNGAALTVYNLNLTGGQLDVGTGQVNVNYATLGGTSPVNAIRTELAAGYAGGQWNGAGIITTAGNAYEGLGYVDTGSSVEIKYAVYGDTNLDGSVNFSDLLTLATDYGMTGADWGQGDFNYDGTINFSDLLTLATNYGVSLTPGMAEANGISPSFAADWNLAEAEVAASVPEPTSIGLLAVGAIGLLARRRRQA